MCNPKIRLPKRLEKTPDPFSAPGTFVGGGFLMSFRQAEPYVGLGLYLK